MLNYRALSTYFPLRSVQKISFLIEIETEFRSCVKPLCWSVTEQGLELNASDPQSVKFPFFIFLGKLRWMTKEGSLGPPKNRVRLVVASQGVGCQALCLVLAPVSPSKPHGNGSKASCGYSWPCPQAQPVGPGIDTWAKLGQWTPSQRWLEWALKESSLSLAGLLSGGNIISGAIGGHTCCIMEKSSVSWSTERSQNETGPERGADGVLITPKS